MLLIYLQYLTIFAVLTLTTASDLTVQSPCPNNFFYDAVYDLGDQTVCPSPYVTEYKPITIQDSCDCCSYGTLQISLNNGTRESVLVDLWFNKSEMTNAWSFNLGDSKSNNGYKGDSGHTNYDAELHNLDESGFYVWSSDKGTVAGEPNVVSVPDSFNIRLTLVIQSGKVQWVSDTTMDFLEQSGLFVFNGPDDIEAGGGNSDYNIYLGLNQVVSGSSSRRGQGLCKAAVRFLCQRDDDVTYTSSPTKPTDQTKSTAPTRSTKPTRPTADPTEPNDNPTAETSRATTDPTRETADPTRPSADPGVNPFKSTKPIGTRGNMLNMLLNGNDINNIYINQGDNAEQTNLGNGNH